MIWNDFNVSNERIVMIILEKNEEKKQKSKVFLLVTVKLIPDITICLFIQCFSSIPRFVARHPHWPLSCFYLLPNPHSHAHKFLLQFHQLFPLQFWYKIPAHFSCNQTTLWYYACSQQRTSSGYSLQFFAWEYWESACCWCRSECCGWLEMKTCLRWCLRKILCYLCTRKTGKKIK